MFRLSASVALYLAVSASASVLTAATPAIGVAVSDGNIIVNNSMIAGNASVFNGTLLETDTARTRVQMKGGAKLQLETASEGRVFSDHIDLQKGTARFSGLSATANGLSIRPEQNSSASVALLGHIVQIAALKGNVRVYNAQGVTVANLFPGRALNLTPQDAGASAPSSMIGCVQKNGDVYTLTDETSNVTVQLRGGNLRAGRRVQVTGTTVAGGTPAGGATQVLAVTNVKDVGGSCRTAAGAAAAGGAAAGAAAAGAAAGISGTTAIVAGVAAAAVAGGAVAAAATSSGNGSGGTSSGVPVGCTGISPCTTK